MQYYGIIEYDDNTTAPILFQLRDMILSGRGDCLIIRYCISYFSSAVCVPLLLVPGTYNSY